MDKIAENQIEVNA